MAFCTSCGAALTGTAFCTSCGRPAPPTAAAAQAPWAASPAPARSSGRTTVLLAAVTVLLVAVAGGLLAQRTGALDDLLGRGTDPPAGPTAASGDGSSSRGPRAAPPPDGPSPDEDVPDEDVPDEPTADVPVTPTAEAPAEPLPGTPVQVVVLASKTEADGGRAAAEALVPAIEAAGHSALVFASQDYSSLRCCFWVAAAGPFPDAASAVRAAGELRALSPEFSTAYQRCVGTVEQCP